MTDYLDLDLSLPEYSLAPADQRLLRDGQSLSDIAKDVSYTEYDSAFGTLDLADPFRLGWNMSASYWSGGSADEINPGPSPGNPPTEYNYSTSKNASIWLLLILGVGTFFIARAL